MKNRNANAEWTKTDTVICVIAGLFLAALQIIFFTPIVFGGNER